MAFPKIFINLPVADLERSKAFFAAVGWPVNPQFTDEKAASVVIGEDIFAMLLTQPFFATFTPKAVVDAGTATEAIVAIGVQTRDEVDQLADRAAEAGAAPLRDPEDHGFMYSRSFADPDGHLWELVWMDPVAAQQGPPQA